MNNQQMMELTTVEKSAFVQPLDHCVYRSFQLGVQHHVLDAPGVLKGRFDGCVGIDMGGLPSTTSGGA